MLSKLSRVHVLLTEGSQFIRKPAEPSCLLYINKVNKEVEGTYTGGGAEYKYKGKQIEIQSSYLVFLRSLYFLLHFFFCWLIFILNRRQSKENRSNTEAFLFYLHIERMEEPTRLNTKENGEKNSPDSIKSSYPSRLHLMQSYSICS